MNKLDKSILFQGFKKRLIEVYGKEEAEKLWHKAGQNFGEFSCQYSDLDSDSRMMILPVAALYKAKPEVLPYLCDYATGIGRKIGKIVHAITSIPGVSKFLWDRMPKLMRDMSSAEKGYTRRIVSETKELVGVDILSCPLHNAAIRIGVPEVARVVCAMDKAYMTGFKYIEYTRTFALGEGDAYCDYRLRYDREKK